MHAIYSHSSINTRNADRQVSAHASITLVYRASAYASITLVYRASVSSIGYVVSGSVAGRSNTRSPAESH